MKKKGIFETRIAKAFDHYKKGELTEFVTELIDTVDRGVRFGWQRDYVNYYVNKELEKLGGKNGKKTKRLEVYRYSNMDW